MKHKKAFLFDLNGTMVDDMPYHVVAWFDILNSLGAGLTMERVTEECYGKNDELLERIFPGRFSADEIVKMSYAKEEAYQTAFRPHLKLIDGLPEYLESAKQHGIRMAIGSAAILFNIDFVIDNLHIRHYFDAIVSAETVAISKPHPETYLKCAQALDAAPNHCLVFEDSPKGVESAQNAGMQSVVILGMHKATDFLQYNNVVYFGKDYHGMPI